MTYYVVRFHADGGQTCIDGCRCLESKEAAEVLAEILSDEPGHRCGPGSVTIEESPIKIEDRGYFNIDPQRPRSTRLWNDTLDSVRFHFGIPLYPSKRKES
jgi:hypothetical protein